MTASAEHTPTTSETFSGLHKITFVDIILWGLRIALLLVVVGGTIGTLIKGTYSTDQVVRTNEEIALELLKAEQAEGTVAPALPRTIGASWDGSPDGHPVAAPAVADAPFRAPPRPHLVRELSRAHGMEVVGPPLALD